MEISKKTIPFFRDLDRFDGDGLSFDHSKRRIWQGRAYLFVDKKGQLSLEFQNCIQRLFSKIIDPLLRLLRIAHSTSYSPRVWDALKEKGWVDKTASLPKRQQIRKIFGEVIGELFKTPAEYDPNKDNTMEQYQKYIYLLENGDAAQITGFLSKLNNPNGYFKNAQDTPLTLALKKESLVALDYLYQLHLKDPTKIDFNLCTMKGESPILLAAKLDLPRSYQLLLLKAGARPQSYRELEKIVAFAGGRAKGGNQKLIRSADAAYEQKKVDWESFWPKPQVI